MYVTGPKGEKWLVVDSEEKFKTGYPSLYEEWEKLASGNLQAGIVALASFATFLAM